jgi:peptide/nickel transport system substrate-binding protein
VGLSVDVAGLNPLLKTDPQSWMAARRIYESLVTDNPTTGQPEPRLAESWSTSPDGRTLTFVLRDNLTWSDGSPLTVDDVIFSLEALLRSKVAPQGSLVAGEIVGAEDYAQGKTDRIAGVSSASRSVTIQLTQPLCTGVDDIGGRGVLPRSVFGKYLAPTDTGKTIDDAPENNAPPLASGPFRFQEWVSQDHIELVCNNRFFLGPPRLDEWVYRVVPDPSTMVAALKTGEVDVAQVSATAADDLVNSGAFQVRSVPGTGYTSIGWNELRGGKEFSQEKPVRQALSYGLNWDQIIATLLRGQAVRALAHTPAPSWAYDPTGLNPYTYDPQRARQLLEADGWSMGNDGIYERNGQRLAFTLWVAQGVLGPAIAQVAAEQYRQIGVDVTLQTEAFEALLQRSISSKDPTYGDQGGRDLDAYLMTWGQIGPDPDAYWYWHSSQLLTGGNRFGYQNATVDQAIETGRTQCAPADRKAAYHQMDLQLNDDQPVSFGYVSDTLLAYNAQLREVEPGPYSFMAQWNVEQWWRAP